MFEVKTVRTGQKRKREGKGDPGDLEGYQGPWRGYVDQVKVSKPTEEQMAVLEEQFGEKQKKKRGEEKDETIEETTLLHSECSPIPFLGTWAYDLGMRPASDPI